MALPIDGNQLRHLTTRLRESTETADDLRALANMFVYYRRVLADAHEQVERLCADLPYAQPTVPRVKTLRTTLWKLRRLPQVRSLAHIRDLAGMRVIVHGTRSDQDELVGRLADLFRAERPPKLIDRRADPRTGYRAVHLEIRRGGILIEIQVRTALQHRWAESFERTADQVGRGIRYGEAVHGNADRLLNGLAAMACRIDRYEAHGTTSDRAIVDRLFERLEERL
jgi:ppGpp synthetase/RelA/SpoT-type nucleotidyltranferase